MEESRKGTVTKMSSLFPADEALKASKRVHDTISERVKEHDQLKSFIGDNTALINLVQKLPDDLHHDIMVPFGKAAFFPGRLVHTNEFLVLLGEGYYAERTSKQTIDILKRRGKTLDAQVDSLKAGMQDLEAEASFFDSTAAEVAEGLVEIREDYIEESSADRVPKAASNMAAAVDEDEFTRMISRFDELEKEELAAESVNESDRDEGLTQLIEVGEIEEMEHPVEIAKVKEEEDECIKAYFEKKRRECSLNNNHKIPEGNLSRSSDECTQTKEGLEINKDVQSKIIFRQDLRNQVESRPMQVAHEVTSNLDDSSSGQCLEPAKSSSKGNTFVVPGVKENVPKETQPLNKVQAFTGTIVEHTHNLREPGNSSSKPTSTTKPVSRFKMQRR